MSKVNSKSSIEEILNNQKCFEFINQRINKIHNHRREILKKAGTGSRLKRSSVDVLTDMNMFSAYPLMDEFRLILHKKSKLPSSVRDLIINIVSVAINQTIHYFDKLDNSKTAE